MRTSALRALRSARTAAPTRAFSTSRVARIEGIEVMDMNLLTDSQKDVREGVSGVVSQFDNKYWREHDLSKEFPFEFHQAIADGGWIGIAQPEKFGGSGLGISEASIMMQTITESGAGFPGAQATHGNIYATQPLAIFGTDAQRADLIPKIISGEYRVCFGVTEPNTGLNTLDLKTTATRNDDGTWNIKGQKTWITAAQHAKVMILLARTTPVDEVKTKAEGLTLFAIPLDKSAPGLDMNPIHKMGGNAVDSNEIWFDNYTVPADCVIGGDENIGKGFRMILHGMNAERCLIAAEALGIGFAALRRAAEYASEREVFGRKIGMNQGIAHPLAECQMHLAAAAAQTYHAARMYDRSQKDKSITPIQVGIAANSAKFLAADAAFNAATRAILTHGGMGFAHEYDVERWLRESFVPRIAPISREMIMNMVAERVLHLPKSY
ncbi:hypothetical protein A1Q2_07791 [Trichosporon asahii var. asahii CBS 8904]|uniref:Acyl-CoA dehydrogenase n=2 Tax=Trichosporon asahii var. asahii TaxID=189963 RepID=K1V236_TRIAC|nr:hypothetical protein A1Q1_01716 [Trichosporon asahii var. asahii CBS 2479]EJT49235.1 hypothetical protein A1Q1_01716 [Trichosporon asahii var. asahii CBS 2479]EKC97994.1 hypothetical protein A1Q2_07791 [Trichosporon asahii var. asahii CBS 8904]